MDLPVGETRGEEGRRGGKERKSLRRDFVYIYIYFLLWGGGKRGEEA